MFGHCGMASPNASHGQRLTALASYGTSLCVDGFTFVKGGMVYRGAY